MEKMKIFVSWSGPRSAAVAEAFREYLPMMNNAFDLWLSSEDIAKGSRSSLEIAKALAAAKAGIICLTPNNLTAPWILFEAGGIAKTVEKTLVCTVLIGLEWSNVSGPLSEFQHTTKLDEKELLKLVQDLNSAAGESARTPTEIERMFKLCWPELKQKFDNLPRDGPTQRPDRNTHDMLAELIDLARRSSTEIEIANKRMDEYLYRSNAVFQSQIDHLANVLTPASSLSPTWHDAAASGKLSAPDGSGAAATEAMNVFYGRVPPSQRAKIANVSNQPKRGVISQGERENPKGGPDKK